MDATLKERNIWRSVKKLWKDSSSYPVYFDNDFMIDRKENQYLVVNLDNLHPEKVSSAFMTVFAFSKKDAEGDLLTALRDYALERIEPGFMDLYNTEVTPWVKIGGIILSDVNCTEMENIPTGAKVKMITVLMQWGAVW